MSDPIDKSITDYLGEHRELPPGLEQGAKDLMPGSTPRVPCPHCGQPITPFKKPPARSRWNGLWLAAAAASFALSFVFPGYFVQCLVVTVICAFKWVVEKRALKTQILIYKALSDDPSGEGSRLHKHASRL